MAAKGLIRRGGVWFHLFEKSIQVVSRHASQTIFLGRPPEDSDVDALCKLIDMGAAMQASRLWDTLASDTLFPQSA